jgi:hypothetical protein
VYNVSIDNVRDKCNVDITKENISSRCKTFDKHSEIISKNFPRVTLVGIEKIVSCQLIVRMFGLDMWMSVHVQLVIYVLLL